MNVNKDPLDQAFGLMKARSQGRVPTNPDLEELVMTELVSAKRPTVSRLTKVGAAIVLCAVATGAAATTGGLDALMDWVSLTGFYELPDGSSGYVEDGRVISGTVNYEGKEYRVEGGHMVDEHGNAIGSVHMESTTCCDEGSRDEDCCNDE